MPRRPRKGCASQCGFGSRLREALSGVRDALRYGRQHSGTLRWSPFGSDRGRYSPQPIGKTSKHAAKATPIRWPVTRPCPRGTRGRRSSPSRARRCRPGAPPARPRRRRRSPWCRRRARTAVSRRPTPPGPRPRARAPGLDLVAEDPAVAGVADRVDDGPAGGDVVGLVEVDPAPGVAEVAGDDDLGPVPAYRRGDHLAERDAVLQHPVGLAEELHGRRRRRPPRTGAAPPRGPPGTASGSMPSMPASPLVTMQ